MYSVEDILNRLVAGEDPTVIANQFADALNAAIDKKNAAVAAAKEKENELKAIIISVIDYIEKYFPEIYDKELREDLDEAVPEIVDALDQAYAEFNKQKSVLNDFKKFRESRGGAVDPIAAFLKSNNL